MKNIVKITVLLVMLLHMGIYVQATGVDNVLQAEEIEIKETEKTTEKVIEETDSVISLIPQKEVMFHAEIIGDDAISRWFVFELYASDGYTLIERRYVTTEHWETSFNMIFEVSEYNIGEKFIIKFVSDNGEMSFNGENGNEFVLETYLAEDEEGKAHYQTAFYGAITPFENKNVSISVYGNEADADYKIFGDEIYISEDFIKELKINLVKEENSWFLSSHTDGLAIEFFDDNIYACKNGVGYNLKYPVFTENEKGYLPLYDIAEYFNCPITFAETDEVLNVSLEYSAYGIVLAKETFVNNSGVDSATDYLIWISKKDHTVNVFTGKKGFWHHYKSYPCALGKPRTPTVEGQFEYIERLDRWNYANYYCGPVMRFYRGYALHSTLIRYNGTPYDDRVGVDISLGCIRLHPEDINELIEYIPFKTKIYITKD